ncbi:MAG TPA: ABC transporter ATP-binding protein [Halanaerobiaceae bacterium]|jgi:peptide/nickel transport system ATP-binding protein|nr:ABC transporter ATP-binding protein [Halanaerobiaceae bacterium]HOA41598.1 ABC transporter ATP-binding protein [Halanaerobiales bacterium]HPZ63593.1 ABC transporter ATP-binding protein [Halanaerobiales bacterium]HQD04573.1 ABC transporter ATP-binding protein [Halanaerobiales bacterium]
MDSNSKYILRTKDLKAYYVLDDLGKKKTVKAVDNVNLNIRKNEIYGIAGESGCGKTSLMKTLYAFIKPPLRLMDGQVLYYRDGEEFDIYSLSKEERRKLRWEYIAYIPQGAMSIFNPVIKIEDTYRDFLNSHLSGKTKDEIFEIAREHIKQLGLPMKVLNSYPHQLSGGMRQRVAIALAALLKPAVIFADEPTTALDVVVQRGVVQLLKDIQKGLENTIILVTHDMGIHANITDRLVIMYAGKIIEEAETVEIFENPIHPYTKYLINSLPRFGDRGTRASAPGNPPSLANLPSGCAFHPRCPFKMDICEEKIPELSEQGNEHMVACWLTSEGVG